MPKNTKPAAAANAPAILSASPCLQRGPEMPGYVYAQAGQSVVAFLQACAGPTQVTVSLHAPSPTSVGGTPLFSGALPPNPNPLLITVPPLGKGVYLIMWTYLAAGYWDIVAELQVAGAARFRKINSNNGDKIPVNAIWSYLEVVG